MKIGKQPSEKYLSIYQAWSELGVIIGMDLLQCSMGEPVLLLDPARDH